MELLQVANFLNGRFLLSNIKIDRAKVLRGELLSSFSVGTLGASYNEKVYFDTPDFFFAERGINVYTVNINGTAKELVIRYDSEQVARVEFLKNIPNFFKLKIGKDESINKYYQEISDAIYKVYPAGLGVNIEEYLRNSTPQVKVFKKRDCYRVVNNTGLKVVMSFDNCEYVYLKKKSKFTQATLDVVGEAVKDNQEFELFLKSLIRDYPKLIKIESNELTVARNNLL